MDFKHFSIEAQKIIESSAYFSVLKKNNELTPLHILYKLLELESIQNDLTKDKTNALIPLLNQELNTLPKVSEVKIDDLYFSKDINLMLEASKKLLTELKAPKVLPIHLLLALFKIKGIKELFKQVGIQYSDLLENLKDAKETTELQKYTINLIELAKNGKLDPVIGRDEEIRRLMQVLSRRTKNNPMLIGEPGVGKTAVAEGLAQRIVAKDVPDTLLDKQLLTLDLGLLIAGASYKGEFEERLKNIISEVEDSHGDIILFIDEIHMLIGAGSSGHDSMDAANLLKPSLARGKFRCIGATTLKEYKHIEKDKALERRFQTIYLKEPSVDEAITILRGIASKYELFHGIKISDSAITAAVKLSARYITDRKLPDKAIDLMDEASSILKIEMESLPTELDSLNRKLISLRIEKEALLKEKDHCHSDLESIIKYIKELEEKYHALKYDWEKEKTVLQELKDKKNLLESSQIELEKAQRQSHYNKAAELQYGSIPKLKSEILELQNKLSNNKQKYYKEYIDEQDIAFVVSSVTGIPINKMLETEKHKILNLDQELNAKVIGQEEAVLAISNSIKRNRAGLNDASKPLSSFLFLGPTGVGKTELSKVLAEALFSDRNSIIRLDMSEYMEKHSVSKLIGAPPGYIGHEAGGYLTEKVKRNPYSILLFDEIEKAHIDVLNIMLQIFDDGILTDSLGNKIDFKNTIIILTSNIGSDVILSENDHMIIEEKIQYLLKQSFKPEFLNRIDDIIIFNKLSPKTIAIIFKKEIEKLNHLLKEKSLQIDFSPEAMQYFIKKGFQPEFGARPLKRVIERDIKNRVATLILEQELKDVLITFYLDENRDIAYRASRLASVS